MTNEKLVKVSGRWAILLSLLIFVCTLIGIFYFGKTHFLTGTEIGGISCEFLTIDEAIERVNYEQGQKKIELIFGDGTTYQVLAKELGIGINAEYIDNLFKKQHSNINEERKYSVDGFITVENEKLRKFLEQIPELQKENMIAPQDAYIIWDEISFSINSEVLGNTIDFEEATNLVLEVLQNQGNVIDFSTITAVNPKTFTEDLIGKQNELNSILNSSINFELIDGSMVNLNSEIIKNWVYLDENGNYEFDIENGVSEFVTNLALKISNINSTYQFTATDLEDPIEVYIPKEIWIQLDQEKEIAEIKTLLGSSETINLAPIYDRKTFSEMLTSYVEVDIARQHIWIYIDGALYLDTACVTGNVSNGYDTPTGVFFLLNKNRDALLEGTNKDGSKYSTPVKYWMRFYKGCGFHDAWWRNEFGKNIYQTNGSHGCINMPSEKAAKMYEIIDSTMPIIIYNSQL